MITKARLGVALRAIEVIDRDSKQELKILRSERAFCKNCRFSAVGLAAVEVLQHLRR